MKKPVLLLMLLALSSCARYHKLSDDEFPQGNAKKANKKLAAQFVRTARAYDEFSTEAIFDALYLSDEVRRHYADIYSRRRGMSNALKDAMTRRELEVNRHWVSFYVLSYLPDRCAPLNEKESAWSLHLHNVKRRKRIEPLSITPVDLSPEIRYFFGDRVTPFKKAYLVKFPAKDAHNNSHIKPGDAFSLVARTVKRSVKLSWSSTQRNDVTAYEDFYWM